MGELHTVVLVDEGMAQYTSAGMGRIVPAGTEGGCGKRLASVSNEMIGLNCTSGDGGQKGSAFRQLAQPLGWLEAARVEALLLLKS